MLVEQVATETTTVNGGTARVIAYTYDADGRRETVTYPSGLVGSYAYDTLGRLASITTPQTGNTITYDANGRVDTIAAGNGVTTTYGYDAEGRLDTIDHAGPLNEDLLSIDHDYDAGGNMTTRTESGFCPAAQEQFERDGRGQLERVTRGGAVEEDYTYDAAGNRTSDLTGTAYSYAAQTHRMTAMGSTTYQYNGRGLQTREDRGAGDYTDFIWSGKDQLTQVTEALTGDTVVYRYDALGRRVGAEVSEGGVTAVKTWAYDGRDLIEYAVDGVRTQEYVHGPGVDRPWAYLEHDGVTTPRYYHTDHLGSVRAITDDSGKVAQAYTYTSFGEATECTFPFPFQPFQYAAREADEDSGLYYYRARYYNPRAGRFISPDPLGAAGGRTNRFLYVGNSPTRFMDPLGLDAIDVRVTEDFVRLINKQFDLGLNFRFTDVILKYLEPKLTNLAGKMVWVNLFGQTSGHDILLNSWYFGDMLNKRWLCQLLDTFLHEALHLGQSRIESYSMDAQDKIWQETWGITRADIHQDLDDQAYEWANFFFPAFYRFWQNRKAEILGLPRVV